MRTVRGRLTDIGAGSAAADRELEAATSEREALTSSLSSAQVILQQSMADAEARSAEITSLQEQALALRSDHGLHVA